MTRTYNKKAMALPYAPGVAKRVRADASSDDGDIVDDGDDDDQPEDSDPENDVFIKVPSSIITNRIDAPVSDHAVYRNRCVPCNKNLSLLHSYSTCY